MTTTATCLHCGRVGHYDPQDERWIHGGIFTADIPPHAFCPSRVNKENWAPST